MFKPFILVLLFATVIKANESETTTTLVDTTSIVSTTTTTKMFTSTLNNSNVLVDSKTLSPKVNFAQYNGKLLVNQTAESSMNGRIITAAHNNNGVTAVSTNGLSMAVVIALIAIVTVVVSAIIISAVFIMKRRFSIWRLNGDGSDSKATGTEEIKESSDNKDTTEVKCEEVNEKDPEVAKQVALAAEQPVSVSVENAQTEQTIENKTEEIAQQASPSSSSPLIEKTEETEQVTPQPTQQQSEPELKEQVTSSSSLIVNVLNELSESVACKLASAHSPAAKSTHSNTVETTESQPLNKEE